MKPDYEGFAKWVMEVFFENEFMGVDIDGCDVQETAIQFGLLKPVEAAEPCGEACNCASFYGADEFPITCYRTNFDVGEPAQKKLDSQESP